MKKLFIIPLLLVVSIMFAGCSNTDILSIVNENISEHRDNMFIDDCDLFYATFVTGEREDPYSVDGVHGEMVPFGLITLIPKSNLKLSDESLTYTIIIDDIEYTGELISSPIDASYSADIGALTDSSDDISITINDSSNSYPFTLSLVSDDFAVSQATAIELAVESLNSSLTEMLSDEDATIECYIKIYKDFSGDEKTYFWYISMVSNDKMVSALISTATGEILSLQS